MNDAKLIKKLSILQGGCIHASEDAENWSMHDALVENAQTIGNAISLIKKMRCENQQLRERLVRQAMYFEQIEAKEQPKSWPLLEDEEGL
jgi:hypothetical protein